MLKEFKERCDVADVPQRGKPVEVYFNLHTHKWSIRQAGRVFLHCDAISLDECKMVVRPAGRAKVLREGRKNVHAFIRGFVRSGHCGHGMVAGIRYNPYQMDTFQRSDSGVPVDSACRVEIDGGSVLGSGLKGGAE